MAADPRGDNRFGEVAVAVAEKDIDIGGRICIVQAHFSGKNIQETITIDVRNRQAMAMIDLPSQQIMGHPSFAIPLIPTQGAGRITGTKDDLRAPTNFELAGRSAGKAL